MDVTIRVVGDRANDRGDILTRLASDVANALGYTDIRLNVSRTGREIDIIGRHKYENRGMVAECKAQQEPVGGADINKFVGSLDAEQRASNRPTHGYFISISGFKDSAREQESAFDPPRLTLLDSRDIVETLVNDRTIVPLHEATGNAGHFLNSVPGRRRLSHAQLLATRTGWLWALSYVSETNDAVLTTCVVHSDGVVLTRSRAGAVTDLDLATILGPPDETRITRQSLIEAYQNYLMTEFGNITLDGMPMDQEVGSKQFRLESLYVPTALTEVDANSSGHRDPLYSPPPFQPPTSLRFRIGRLLARHRRLAVLGTPGAGKSTLLKRLIVAYADPSRRPAVDDALPDRDLLPIPIRCRNLNELARRPIREIIAEQVRRAELADEGNAEFNDYVGERLRAGEAMLLVDGLDEIRSDSDRVALVLQLRTFLATYPEIFLVTTSREVGFRVVAGPIASMCATFRVAELSERGIARLVQSWYTEVFGITEKSRNDAADLVSRIAASDRIQRLSGNPLMLTTLLLVRRWVGELPRRRSILYQKAIEVLLMTWNVEGHDPIELDDVLPQLAFAAYRMMADSKSRISDSELANLFQSARDAMPDLLSFAQTSTARLTRRVEERSSILVLSGYDLVDGRTVPLYEFRHLTFQEYLCALAIANQWLPSDLASRSLGELVAERIGVADWNEVVLLTTALSGRRASVIVEGITERLTLAVADGPAEPQVAAAGDDALRLAQLIVDCLADDVPLTPAVAEGAIAAALSTFTDSLAEDPNVDFLDTEGLAGSRYESLFVDMLRDHLVAGDEPLDVYAQFLARPALARVGADANDGTGQVVVALLESDVLARRIDGLACTLALCWPFDGVIRTPDLAASERTAALTAVARLVVRECTPAERLMCYWIVGWWGTWLADDKLINALQVKLLESWRFEPSSIARDFAAGALAETPIVGGWDVDGSGLDTDLSEFLEEQLTSAEFGRRSKLAALVTSYYLGEPLSSTQIVDFIRRDDKLTSDIGSIESCVRLLSSIGPPATEVLAKLEAARDRRLRDDADAAAEGEYLERYNEYVDDDFSRAESGD